MSGRSSRLDRSEVPRQSYLSATLHPWPCLCFLLPLLLAYEGGVVYMGGAHPESLRGGADTWLEWGFEALGCGQHYLVPALMVVILLGWSWLRRHDRPKDLLGVCSGMAIESVLCALGLWWLSRRLGPLVDGLGLMLELSPSDDEIFSRLITYVGAGIYEELLFRLILFRCLARGLRLIDLPDPLAFFVAAIAASLAFATAHHLGSGGESYDGFAFLFRTLAGLYFTLLFVLRGFGVAVGAHACYDIIVGMTLA